MSRPERYGCTTSRASAGSVEPPGEGDERCPSHHHQLLNDLEIVRQRVGPRRPWIASEARDASGAVGVRDVGGIALRRERELAVGRLDPGVEAVDEDDTSRRWRGRDGEHRVVAARADAVDSTEGEATESVGFEPFRGGRDHDAATAMR